MRHSCLVLAAILIPVVGVLQAQTRYEKASPFDALRWKSDKPEVKVDSTWFGLVAIHDQSVEDILSFCRKTYSSEERARKRFAEDLVEVLSRMGHAPGATVDLTLKSLESGERVKRAGVSMTRQKRESVRRSLRGKSDAPKGPAAKVSKPQADADLDRLRWILKNRFSYRDLNGVDLDRAIQKAKDTIKGEVTIDFFATEVMKVLAQFGDGHTRVRGSYKILPNGFTPFSIVPHEGRLAVLSKSGRRLLDENHPYLHSIDGISVDKWQNAVRPIVAKTTPGFVALVTAERLQMIQFARRELGLEPKPTLIVRLMNKRGQKSKPMTLEVAGRPPYGRDYPRKEAKLIGKVGYLRIPQMDSGKEFTSWLSASMIQFKKTKGMIIDVRDNGGGSRESLLTLLPYFMSTREAPHVINVAAYRLGENDRADDPQGHLANRFLYPASWPEWSKTERAVINKLQKSFKPDWKLPQGEFSDWHFALVSTKRYPASFHYKKPVIILADQGCFSATDIFLGGFKGRKNVTIMGETSGGGSGRSRGHDLPNSRLSLRVSSMASFRANGERYDGKGIAPDVKMTPTLTDLTGQSDSILKAALKRLK